jgi:signal transduction histidine kinase
VARGRGDIPFNSVVFCFIAFIVACGITQHVIGVAELLYPAYWVDGALKAATAMVLLATFGLLLKLMPSILSIPSHADLKEILNQRTTSMLESTTVCAMAVDREWKVQYINRNAMELLSIRGNSQGMSFWEVFPSHLPAAKEALKKVMKTRQSVSFDEYYAPLDLSSTVQAHPWDNGGIAVFFNDVSEQKRLLRELEKERAQRQQRIEVLARFAAGIAHEIKNPLAIIHARASDLCELAAHENALPAQSVVAACESVVRTSDRAIRILRGLEALARDGSHDEMQEAEAGDMVDLAVDLVKRRYETRGITLETSVPKALPVIECRKVQIGQVLMNLLNNAFDAVDASPQSERWVRVVVRTEASVKDGREWMLIDVTDGGPPMTPETREHLMESFYTTKALTGGMGIGLSISREIAEKHGGSLDLEDCNGHTCFRLALPVGAARREGVAA